MLKTMDAATLVNTDLSLYDVLDVRTPLEYGLGTLKGAINVEYDPEQDAFTAQAEERIAALSKDREVLVFCHSGPRSELAAAELEARGFSVTDVPGGYRAYQRALYAQ